MTGIKASDIVRVGEVRQCHPRTTFAVDTANYQAHHSTKKNGSGPLRRSQNTEDKVFAVKYFQYLPNWSLSGLALYNLDPKAFPSP